jgi:hypothetical protein
VGLEWGVYDRQSSLPENSNDRVTAIIAMLPCLMPPYYRLGNFANCKQIMYFLRNYRDWHRKLKSAVISRIFQQKRKKHSLTEMVIKHRCVTHHTAFHYFLFLLIKNSFTYLSSLK